MSCDAEVLTVSAVRMGSEKSLVFELFDFIAVIVKKYRSKGKENGIVNSS